MVFVNSCPYLGGAELWHLRTAESLRERGHQILTLLREGPMAKKAIEAGLPAAVLPMSFDLDVYTMVRAFLYFKREKPDLILLNDQREVRVIAPAAAAAGIKIRVQRKGWPFLKGSWRDRLAYRFFVTHLIAVSRDVERIFIERSGMPAERIEFIPNGVDLKRFGAGKNGSLRRRLGAGSGEKIVGSAGRIVSQKGYDLLLEAAALMKGRGIETWFAIAGEGEKREELERTARDRGLARFVFLGAIDDVPGFLAGLDVFAFPSRMEARSNALAEAMAAGLPLAASDVPGNDEMVSDGENGTLVPPEDPKALADALVRLIEDEDLARRLGARARAYAETELDGEKLILKLESYLSGLVEKAGGGA